MTSPFMVTVVLLDPQPLWMSSAPAATFQDLAGEWSHKEPGKRVCLLHWWSPENCLQMAPEDEPVKKEEGRVE